MKKTLLLAAAAAIVSCTQQEQTTPMQTITIGLRGAVESHTMTKSAESVRELIGSTLLTSATLTLVNADTGNSYSVKTGGSISLPVGTYAVTGKYNGNGVASLSGAVTMDKPSFTISDEIQVVSGTSAYSVTPVFNCFAVVAGDDVSAYSYTDGSKNYTSAKAVTDSEGNKLLFVRIESASTGLPFTLTPADTGAYDTTTFTFYTSSTLAAAVEGGVYAQDGNFYIMHPSEVVTEESGFGLDYPSWGEGTI